MMIGTSQKSRSMISRLEMFVATLLLVLMTSSRSRSSSSKWTASGFVLEPGVIIETRKTIDNTMSYNDRGTTTAFQTKTTKTTTKRRSVFGSYPSKATMPVTSSSSSLYLGIRSSHTPPDVYQYNPHKAKRPAVTRSSASPSRTIQILLSSSGSSNNDNSDNSDGWDDDEDSSISDNNNNNNEDYRKLASLKQQKQQQQQQRNEPEERDLFIPIFAIVSITGFLGAYGYETLRLASRGELYLPWN